MIHVMRAVGESLVEPTGHARGKIVLGVASLATVVNALDLRSVGSGLIAVASVAAFLYTTFHGVKDKARHDRDRANLEAELAYKQMCLESEIKLRKTKEEADATSLTAQLEGITAKLAASQANEEKIRANEHAIRNLLDNSNKELWLKNDQINRMTTQLAISTENHAKMMVELEESRRQISELIAKLNASTPNFAPTSETT